MPKYFIANGVWAFSWKINGGRGERDYPERKVTSAKPTHLMPKEQILRSQKY